MSTNAITDSGGTSAHRRPRKASSRVSRTPRGIATTAPWTSERAAIDTPNGSATDLNIVRAIALQVGHVRRSSRWAVRRAAPPALAARGDGAARGRTRGGADDDRDERQHLGTEARPARAR